jgi:hypothetical protein
MLKRQCEEKARAIDMSKHVDQPKTMIFRGFLHRAHFLDRENVEIQLRGSASAFQIAPSKITQQVKR